MLSLARCMNLILSGTLSLPITSCHLLSKTNFSSFPPGEGIVCANVGLRQGIAINDKQRFEIRVGVRKPEQFANNPLRDVWPTDWTANIEMRDWESNNKRIVVGRQLKKGDQFTFHNVTWKILEIGTNGVYVDHQLECPHSYIHIKHLF
jgi:hypothetical protein